MRLAGLHLQLKRVVHEQNTRLAVSSQVQRGSVTDKWVFCEGVLPFEVAAGMPTEFSISSDNLRISQNLRYLGQFTIVNRKLINLPFEWTPMQVVATSSFRQISRRTNDFVKCYEKCHSCFYHSLGSLLSHFVDVRTFCWLFILAFFFFVKLEKIKLRSAFKKCLKWSAYCDHFFLITLSENGYW
jgi:hypothetical protein